MVPTTTDTLAGILVACREKSKEAFKQRMHTLIRNGDPHDGIIRDTTTRAFAAPGRLDIGARGSDWLGDDVLDDSD